MAVIEDPVFDCDLCGRRYYLCNDRVDFPHESSPRILRESRLEVVRNYKSKCDCRGPQWLTVKPGTPYKRDEATGLWREVTAEELHIGRSQGMLKVKIEINLTSAEHIDEVKRAIEAGLLEIGRLNAKGSLVQIAKVHVTEEKTAWSGVFNNNTGVVENG